MKSLEFENEVTSIRFYNPNKDIIVSVYKSTYGSTKRFWVSSNEHTRPYTHIYDAIDSAKKYIFAYYEFKPYLSRSYIYNKDTDNPVSISPNWQDEYFLNSKEIYKSDFRSFKEAKDAYIEAVVKIKINNDHALNDWSYLDNFKKDVVKNELLEENKTAMSTSITTTTDTRNLDEDFGGFTYVRGKGQWEAYKNNKKGTGPTLSQAVKNWKELHAPKFDIKKIGHIKVANEILLDVYQTGWDQIEFFIPFEGPENNILSDLSRVGPTLTRPDWINSALYRHNFFDK